MKDINLYKHEQWTQLISIKYEASSIYTKPTLATRQKKIEKNQVTRLTYQKIVHAKVLDVLSKSNSGSMFTAKLREKNINCSVQYENKNIKEIRFVDHSTRSVFSCGDLGISIHALFSRQSKGTDQIQNEIFGVNEQHTSPELNNPVLLSLLEKLLESEYHQPDLSPEFLRKKKKKRTR